MEFLKFILVFIICIGLSLFIAYKMMLFFSNENEKTKTRKGRAKVFFHNNMEKNEKERKRHNDKFNREVFKTRIQAHLLPAALAVLLVVLIINTMIIPKKEKEVASVPPIFETQKPEILPKPTEEEPKKIPALKNDEIYSWTDETGRRHYQNSKTAPEGTNRETPVIITQNNSILVPVIIGHRGRTIQTTMILDTGCSLTLLHHTIAQQLQPNFIRQGTSTVADGRKINSTHVTVDFIQVGPFMEHNFIASTYYIQNAERLKYQGLLGMEFLKKHPFQIDTKRSVIRWM